jgi:hypothetical protein
MPVRAGEEKAVIRLNMGEIIVTRIFTDKDGKQTDSVKVESGEGLKYPSPQKVLDELLGQIGFDPFAFVHLDSDKQAEMLSQMVPLRVDLDELAEADRADREARRDINRDGKALVARLESMPALVCDLPEAVDREALLADLGTAADTNSAIEREKMDREQRQQTIDGRKAKVGELTALISRLDDQIKSTKAEIDMLGKGTKERETELAGLPPIANPVDTDAIRVKLRDAERNQKIIDDEAARVALAAEVEAKRKASQALTDLIEARALDRAAALAEAPMPIPGLSFAMTEDGKKRVMFRGIPFEQANTAEQLRASTAIAMAANPHLRVLRIKDGSLLDEDAMKMLSEMATAEDFQLFIEVVRTDESVGFIIEDGSVRGAPIAEPSAEEKPKARAKPKADKPDGALL